MPVIATQISNEVLGYAQDASQTTLSQHNTYDPLATQKRRGVVSGTGVLPSNADGGQHSQSIITTTVPTKEGKEKKKRTPEEKAERQAKKEAKAAKKEAKVKRQAEKAKPFQNLQERSFDNAATLATSFDNQDHSKSQGAPHTANSAFPPSCQSVVPSNQHMAPIALTDSVRTSPSPLPLEVKCSSAAQTSASQDASKRKMRRRDHRTSVEPFDRAQEQKTQEHTSKASIEGSERYQERKIKEYKWKPSRLPVPTTINVNAPTHTTRPDPGPKHQSGDPEFTSNTLVKPILTQGSYTYLPLAQNDVVATAYSHDYGQQVTSASHPAMMIGDEAQDDRDDSYGCCPWLYGGRESEYQLEEVKGKQANRPEKQKSKDEDDDDVCVVM
ncbi:hypothetical protein SLS60_009300 [Paraconiothyrium brasiliense]|uniref:Uncharacterized protein n=1 Tax=Paraconiothyrium brasiliense TaxID=300254 RepID=A0ABR3QY16_9PLEO